MVTTLTAENREYIPTAWEDVPCPLCGNRASRTLEKFGPGLRYKYERCGECHLAYLNPRPRYDSEFVATAYDIYIPTVDDLWKDGVFTAKGLQLKELADEVMDGVEARLGRKGRMLEIGCATGFFCRIARDRGWDVTPVDVSPTMTDLAKSEFGLPALCGNWLDMSIVGPFDWIHCSHVIEHVPNPGEWLERFRSLLTPDGVLCLEVPNMDSLDRRLKRGLTSVGLRRPKPWAAWRTPDHLYEPCEESFRRFAPAHGFKVEEVLTYSRKHATTGLGALVYHRWLKAGSNLRFFLRPTSPR